MHKDHGIAVRASMLAGLGVSADRRLHLDVVSLCNIFCCRPYCCQICPEYIFAACTTGPGPYVQQLLKPACSNLPAAVGIPSLLKAALLSSGTSPLQLQKSS